MIRLIVGSAVIALATHKFVEDIDLRRQQKEARQAMSPKQREAVDLGKSQEWYGLSPLYQLLYVYAKIHQFVTRPAILLFIGIMILFWQYA